MSASDAQISDAQISDAQISDVQSQATGAGLLGFELRSEQLTAVRAVPAGRDTLAVLPTGAGKRLVVLFDRVGYETLSAAAVAVAVAEGSLLERS